MKFYSEVLDKMFDDVDTLTTEENEFIEAQEREKLAADMREAEKEVFLNELMEARALKEEAVNNFYDLYNKYVDTYHEYPKMTSVKKDEDKKSEDVFDKFLREIFKY